MVLTVETGIDPFQTNTSPDAILPNPYDILHMECADWHLSLQWLSQPSAQSPWLLVITMGSSQAEDFGSKEVKNDK